MLLPIALKKIKSGTLMFFFLAFLFLLPPITQAAPGDLDPSFGNGGKIVTDINNVNNRANAIAIQPDGKMIVGGYVNNATLDFALARYNTDGTLDTSFGTGGIVMTDINGLNEEVNSLAIQADGKIVALGENNNHPSHTLSGFVLARYMPNGSLDTTFGTGGKVITHFAEFFHSAGCLVIQPDGKIVAAGSAPNSSNQRGAAFARYDINGTLDNTFGTGGKVLVFFGIANNQEGGASSVALQSDGKLVAAGGSSGDFALLRLNPDGSLDSGFGTAGKVTTNINGNDNARDISIQTDGKIVAAGSSGGGFTLVRYNTDGTLDNTFDGDGKVTTIVGNAENFGGAVILQPDGKIVQGGEGGVFPNRDFALVRYNTNGSIDSSFGTNGIVVTPIGNNTFDGATALDLQPDGKIIQVGYTNLIDTAIGDFVVVRYLNDSFAPMPKTAFDFDGDGKTDISIFRPSVGEWWINRSSTSQTIAAQFGTASDKIVPADFSGDGKSDIAVYRPSSGEWFILRSEDSSYYSVPFGAAGDIPAPADFDADGKADTAVFRSSSGTWFIQKSAGGTDIVTFGQAGDKPVVGDYDGDGKADIAIYRPSNGQWWINRSSTGIIAAAFGTSSDKPVQGDYSGDGKTDIAIWRASTGEWFILRSEDASYYSIPFGASGDKLAPGDYDGDGKTDPAVFRDGTWYVQRSTDGILIVTFGLPGDLPTPSAFIP